jgi:hypothetical protein
MAQGTGIDATMAVLASTLNSFVQKDIAPTVYDEVLKHNPVLYRFYRKKKVIDGGGSLIWPILKQSKVFGGAYAGAQQLTHGVEDTGAPAEVQWRHYYEDVTIPRTDMLKARTPYAKVDLVKFKFDEAILNLRSRISSGSYNTFTADAGLGLDHLLQAIDDGTDFTTYAGIAHSNTYWKPGVSGLGRVSKASAAVTSLTEIESIYSECSDGDEQPTLIIMTPKAEQFMWGQLQALQRYTRDEEMTKAGFENFKFNRAVCVTDRNLVGASSFTALMGGIILINENWVDFVSHEEEDFAVDPILPGTPSERSLNTKVVWSGNWRVKILRYQGKLVNASNF